MSLLHNKIYFDVFLFLMLKYEKHLTTLHVYISKHQKWPTCDILVGKKERNTLFLFIMCTHPAK